MRLSTVTRNSDGTERVRIRPFGRLSTGLAKRIDDPSFDIPPFDPVTIFSSNEKFEEKGSEDVLYDAQLEDEITLNQKALPANSSEYSDTRAFSNEEIEASLRKDLPVLKASLEDGTILAHAGAISYVDPTRFEPQAETVQDRFDALAIVIQDENVSTFRKSDRFTRLEDIQRTQVVTIDEERSVQDIIRHAANIEEGADAIAVALFGSAAGQTLSTDHELQLSYAGNYPDARPGIVRLFEGGNHKVTLARTDSGSYIPMAPPEEEEVSEQEEIQYAPFSSTYRAIYETALKNDVPKPLIRELIRIYAFDTDFRRSIHKTDKMEVFYSLDPDTEEATEESEILYTSLDIDGVKRRYYRFKTTDDGEVDYYDENGRSAKKFLLRQPVPRAKFRSGFGYRRHPILGRVRLHKGVDWSAPRGTPIFAAGNGVIEDAKWFSGYGRWIKIRHANGYKTGYAHMTRFAKGMRPGVRVRQGQIIGYVGSTGLSTGPHLHYEVIVNGRHVNPMRIRLPRGRVLGGTQLADFERERNRINQLLEEAGPQSSEQIAFNTTQ